MRSIDNPDELLCTARRVIKGLLAMASSARYLSELQQIDRLLTHDVFPNAPFAPPTSHDATRDS